MDTSTHPFCANGHIWTIGSGFPTIWERVERDFEGITFSVGKGGLEGFLVGLLSSTGLKDGDTLRSEGGRTGGFELAPLFSRPFHFLGCRCFSH